VSLHALDIHSLLRAAAPDDVPVVGVDDAVVTLVYLTPESYSARVSSDASTLATIDGHPLIRGEMCAASQTLRLVLWYGPQVAIAPPAPVSAKKK
jgi:hypothetical protein